MNVNKVLLVGRVTRDPELRTTPSGQTVTSLGIATNRFWKDKSGQRQEKTEFHNVILWGRMAEIAGQYLTKGQEAFIEGRLESRTYTGKDGIERKVTDVIGENLQLGSKPQGRSTGGSSYNQQSPQSSTPTKTENPVEKIPTINIDEDQEEIRLEDVPF